MDKTLQFVLDNTKDGKFTFPEGCRTTEQIIEDLEKELLETQEQLDIRDKAMVELAKMVSSWDCWLDEIKDCNCDGATDACISARIEWALKKARES